MDILLPHAWSLRLSIRRLFWGYPISLFFGLLYVRETKNFGNRLPSGCFSPTSTTRPRFSFKGNLGTKELYFLPRSQPMHWFVVSSSPSYLRFTPSVSIALTNLGSQGRIFIFGVPVPNTNVSMDRESLPTFHKLLSWSMVSCLAGMMTRCLRGL